MRLSDKVIRFLVTALFMAGGYVFLDFIYFDATRTGMELLLYIMFKVGVGIFLVSILFHLSDRPYNKHMKSGSI